jgi:hypothetical protein
MGGNTNPSGTVLAFVSPTRERLGACQLTLGRLVEIDASGVPHVVLAGDASQTRRPACATLPLAPTHVGTRVTVLLEPEGGEVIITGIVRSREETARELAAAGACHVAIDGETLLLSAEREIVLRCGPSSITLTRDGKVVIRGANLLQTASGVNRICGATVEIN